MFTQIALDLANDTAEKENIAQTADYDCRAKQFWVRTTPTDKAAKHTAAFG